MIFIVTLDLTHLRASFVKLNQVFIILHLGSMTKFSTANFGLNILSESDGNDRLQRTVCLAKGFNHIIN